VITTVCPVNEIMISPWFESVSNDGSHYPLVCGKDSTAAKCGGRGTPVPTRKFEQVPAQKLFNTGPQP
jgi:hypothetical protein